MTLDIRSILGLEAEPGLGIDKVMDRTGVDEAKPLSLVSDILAKRDKLNEEAEERAKELDSKEEESEEDTSDDEDSEDGDGEDDGDGGDDDFDDEFDDPAEDDDSSDDEDDSEDEDKDDKDDEDTGEDPDKEITLESFQDPIKKLFGSWDFFQALRKTGKERLLALESFGISFEDHGEIDEDTAVVHVKEPILEALTRMGEINKKYIDNTESFINKLTVSIPKLDERLVNFLAVFERGEVVFTNKLITDVNILQTVAYDSTVNLRESLKVMRNFNSDTNDISKIITNSNFDDLKDAFASKGFVEKVNELQYKKRLPGFNFVVVNLPDFKNYLKTNPLEYQYYLLKEDNPSIVYDLRGVSVTEENDVLYYTETLKSIILDMSLSIDILKLVLKHFHDYMDTLKVLKVNVEQDEIEKLSDLNLDEKVKEFIVFKLIVELVSVNINLSATFVTGFMEVLNSALEFKGIDKPDNDSEESDTSTEDDDESNDETDGDGEW